LTLPGGASFVATGAAAALAVVWIVETANLARPTAALEQAGIAALAVYALFALARASRHVALLFVVVAGAGAALAWSLGQPALLADGVRKALVFGAFLPAVMLLRATLVQAGRVTAWRAAYHGLSGSERTSWTLLATHAVAAIFNVGAMFILAPVVGGERDSPERRVAASTSVRAAGLAVAWSPFFVATGYVNAMVPSVRLEHAVAVGAGAALIGLACAYTMFTPDLRWDGFRRSVARLGAVVVPTLVAVAVVLAVSTVTGFGATRTVALTLPVLCFAWMASTRGAAVRAVFTDTFRSLSGVSNELIVILGAAMLGSVVAQLPALQGVDALTLPGALSGIWLIGVAVAATVLAGQIGLHPMITASVIVPLAAGSRFGISDLVLVEAFVLAWALSASIAVWTLPVAAASSTFGIPVRELVTRANALYVVVWGALGVAYLGALDWVLSR
jgi:hypothetical protein